MIVFYKKNLLLLIGLMIVFPSFASPLGCKAKIKLQDYEANTIAIKNNSSDEANIDFVLSQMVPIYHDGCSQDSNVDWFFRPYFAFTGQFGFYALGDRHSKPVIGKRFNPKIFLRHWIGEENYFDIGYAHESNGQSIDNESAYTVIKNNAIANGESADYVNDYLSRGWDYLDFNINVKPVNNSVFAAFTQIRLKYFLEDGLFQGLQEEYYPWETSNGKSRAEVDGISLKLKLSTFKADSNSGLKSELLYTTGYKNIFKNNTYTYSITFKGSSGAPVPLRLWISKGYNSSLTNYYINTTSIGFGLELRNFIVDL